ncbi:unnamed protein product [Paramecium sonneborni]|uniref:PAS domain-containing protein n=1 Tax=Paramecium sonneborni TaxID=65129 RepID=A0A8S1P516_9CILI|nr:unnamed protein product [Paramecium sonneborni]
MRNFLLQAKIFYIQQFLTIKGLWKKSFELSMMLLIMENLQLFSLITQSINVLNNANYFKPIHSLLNLFRLYSIVGEQIEVHIGYMFLGFLLTLCTFMFFIHLIGNTRIITKNNQQMLEMPLELNQIKQIEKNRKIKKFISLYMQIYQTIIRIPLQYSHFHILAQYSLTNSPTQFILIGTSVSVFSITLQLIFSFFIDLHSFEFKMKKQDFLGTFNTQKVHIIFAFQTLLIILLGFEVQSIVIQIFYIIFLFMNIIFSYNQLVYVEIQFSRIQLHISCYILIYEITLLIAQYRNISFELNLIGLMLFGYPFVSYILKTIIERQKLKSLNFSSQSLEKQLRVIYYLFKKQIKLKKEQRSLDPLEALAMYSFISNHLRYCSLNRDRKLQKQIKMRFKCFCEEFADRDNFKFDSIQEMKVFAKELIAQTLEDEILETQDTYLALIYIYFLVQVKKLPTQAIYEVIRLSLSSQDMALKEKAIIYKLKYDALEEFDSLVKKNDLKNQKYVFKRVYQYEESLSVIKSNIHLIVRQFKEWYGLILTSVIDIDQLVIIGFNILKNIKFVETQLQNAFQINPLSNECDTLYNLFAKYLQFNKIRPKMYRQDGKLVQQFMHSIEKTIFDPGSCVIQITLLQPRGNVLRYTRSFQQAIGFKDEEIKDQNIHRFMPQIIADDHDRYLDNFVERGRIIVVRSEVRVILGKNKGQFLIPINTRLRIETSPTEFGATALITPVNLTFGYMMLNEKGQIEEITQNIFEEMFQKNLGIQIGQLRGLDCLFFIPDLAKIWEEIYDDNFDKLDRKFDCQFIIPMVSQSRSMSQSQISKGIQKNLIQKQIYRNFENQPTENAIYQVNLHVVSLVTINLKLVILELQDFRLLPNQKITSKQIIQLRVRTTQQFNISQFQNSTSYREQLSLQNSPWVLDCDLEYNLLQEEERMIDEVKHQLATVNITNTTNHQQIQLIQYAQDEEDLLPEQQQQQQDEQIITSVLKLDEVRKQDKIQNQNMSIGSRSSQNNQTTLKRQMKDCIADQTIINKKMAVVLILFYSIVIGSYVLNFLVFQNNYQKIQLNQSNQNLPYQLSYFYNEFIISHYYKQHQQIFQFTELQQICLDFYQKEIKNVDKSLQNIPEISNLLSKPLKQKVVDVIQQMANIIKVEGKINEFEYFNNTNDFQWIVQALYQADTTQNITNIQYIVIAEEIALILFISWYAYKCIVIIQMKTKVYKLFNTFTTDVIQEQYVIFSTLYALMNSSKYKRGENYEDSFDSVINSAFLRQSSHGLLEKYQKVGKRIKQLKNNSIQIIFFLFVLILIIVCSIYFVGSYLLHNDTIDSIITQFNDKILFSKAYHEITQAFAQTVVFLNTNITEEQIQIQNSTVIKLSELKKRLSLYQQDETIYNLVTKAACDIFNYSLSGFQVYDELFSYEQCTSYSILMRGLSVTFSDLCDQQLRFLQDIISNSSKEYLISNYYSVSSQIERLYDSMGFFVIVATLTNQIQEQIQNNIDVNIIMVVFSGLLMTISIIMMVMSMRKVRHAYQSSKKLLTLIPYDRLVENAYIISFIQQDIKLQN